MQTKNKKPIILFFVIAISLLFSSCASYLRTKYSGDAQSGINIITTDTTAVIRLAKNTGPLRSTLIFDGRAYQSPYRVYKYYLPKMYKKATLQLSAYGQTKSINIARIKDTGWIWIEGLVPWLYESIAGKLYYYNDVYLNREFHQQ
jgi:uncharacterized membrane protein